MDADLSYQELYKMAYNLVMGSQTAMLYTGLDEVIRYGNLDIVFAPCLTRFSAL